MEALVKKLKVKNEPLKFYKGDENGVVVEKKDYKTSIFKNQYIQALNLFDELSERVETGKEVLQTNIIAFCGDRGEGKTSCMLTVRHIIENQELDTFKELVGSIPMKSLGGYDFLEMIEPSFFDQEHNILELVIGQLYRKFKEIELDERFCGSDLYKRVLGLFNKVKKCATLLISSTTNIYDSIEELDELAASMSLRKYMNDLLEEYLKLAGKELLVITIDDMDYNWQGAYDMTKMLSKYLSGDKCIIMVSVSIKQLVEVVKTSFENDIQHEDISIDFDSIAAKYINKLIPLHYRVEMPKVLDMCDTPIEIYERIPDKMDLLVDKYDTIKQCMVELIFQKTRFLFYNSVLNVSLIVPDDLRSLRHLLGLLLSMEDYDKNSDKEEVVRRNLENKRIFQSYLYHTWTQQLKKEDREFAQRLVYNDQSTVNKLVVDYLKKKTDEKIKEDAFCQAIFSSANYTYNVSVGDVFYVLDYISRNAIDRESKLLVFFLRSYYSILLYTYYDMISESITTLHPERSNSNEELFRADSWFNKANSMQKIVNGSYFTYKSGTILRTMFDDKVVALDLLCIGANRLHQLLYRIKRGLHHYDTMSKDEQKKFQQDFVLAELFVMSISRRTYEKGNAKVDIDRDIPNPFFVESFGEDVRYYVFDILAPFVNLINVKFTYGRFQEIAGDMYSFARKHDWTLLRKMMKMALGNSVVPEGEDELDYQELKLASDAIIRNAEILTMLKERIESLDNVFINERAQSKTVEGFYRLLTENADMKTYERVNGKYKHIGYRFLETIADELEHCNEDAYLNIIFSQLMEERDKNNTQAKNQLQD